MGGACSGTPSEVLRRISQSRKLRHSARSTLKCKKWARPLAPAGPPARAKSASNGPSVGVAQIRRERYVAGWPGRFAYTPPAALTPRRESFGPLSDSAETGGGR